MPSDNTDPLAAIHRALVVVASVFGMGAESVVAIEVTAKAKKPGYRVVGTGYGVVLHSSGNYATTWSIADDESFKVKYGKPVEFLGVAAGECASYIAAKMTRERLRESGIE